MKLIGKAALATVVAFLTVLVLLCVCVAVQKTYKDAIDQEHWYNITGQRSISLPIEPSAAQVITLTFVGVGIFGLGILGLFKIQKLDPALQKLEPAPTKTAPEPNTAPPKIMIKHVDPPNTTIKHLGDPQ